MSCETELIRIIRDVLNGSTAAADPVVGDWQAVLDYAQKQGLLMFIYQFVGRLQEADRPDRTAMDRLRRCFAAEVSRSVQQSSAVKEMRDAFEKAGIDNLFFKGAVTKTRYQNELLRSMGDIDFLYKPEDDGRLKAVMKKLGFSYESNGRVHDIYRRNGFVLAEAHRRLLSPVSPYSGFGNDIWNRARRLEDRTHSYEMYLEDEIVFNIIHLASHFKKGGAGIRYVIDVWVYRQMDYDRNRVEENLKQLGLDQFYQQILLLAERWFGTNGADTELIRQLEEYILSGGIFGSNRNRNDAVIAGGKKQYLKRVLFPGFEEMQSMFPWLKHRIFLPWAWFRRSAESFVMRRKNVRVLIMPVKNGSIKNAEQLAAFYHDCGL